MRTSSMALYVAAVLILAACKSEEPASPPAPASASSGVAATRSPSASGPSPTASAHATSPPGTAAPAKGGACTLVGAFSGNYPPGPFPFSGTPLEFTLNADGTGLTHSQRADQDLAWKVEGGTFSLHGTKVQKGGRFSCAKDDVGQYAFTFSPDCNTVSFKLVKDPCRGRTLTMDGLTVKRK